MTKLLKVLLAILALAVAGNVAAQPPAAHPETTEDVLSIQGARLPDDVAPVGYDITVTPDAGSLTTSGTEVIDIEVKRPVRAITLNALRINFGLVRLENGETAQTETDSQGQTATFTFRREIRAGPHRLTIAFASGIATIPYGLFAVDYRDPEGRIQRLLATQFESTAAHRFIPCWDHPSAKALFTLHVVAPGDRMVISNTPIQHTTQLDDGRQKVDFAATPKMSSYLLYLAIGDFERIHRKVDNVDVGVITLRGKTGQGQYALDAAADILHDYDSYFGLHYPLPKMDMIAAPAHGAGFAAMENWGALFYTEDSLLIPPKGARGSGDFARRYVFNVIAHEMGHQWFGDLVTMRDWNELWLNEGFANWMAVKAADALHPEWQAWADDLGSREGAMALDARASTPPIVGPAGSTATTPDVITYDKGEYVVRTLETYLGEDAFRDGVRRYMRDHQYGNTTSDDLWAALKTTSGVDVSAIAHSFTDQPGIPLIEVETVPTGLRLVQARFGWDAQARALETWLTPVAIAPFNPSGVREPLVSANSSLDLKISPGATTVVNAGQKTYLRVDYDSTSFAVVRRAFATLSAIDQIGILDDQKALAGAGYRPLSQYMSLIRQIPLDDAPLVWSQVVDQFLSLDALYADGPERTAYHSAVMAIVGPASDHLRKGGPEDPADISALRAGLLQLSYRFAKEQPRPLFSPKDRDERLAMINSWVAGG